MDENYISTVLNRMPKVISSKGKQIVNKVTSAKRGQYIIKLMDKIQNKVIGSSAAGAKRDGMRKEFV